MGLRGRVEGGQAGCENFKKKKKFWGEGVGGGEGSGLMGVRLDVNEELKFCENFEKKIGWGEGEG